MTITRQPNKLKAENIKETLGLFISPQGETIEVRQSHIGTVILNPAKFGLTTHEIESIYDKHKEPLGIEAGSPLVTPA